MIPRLQAEGSPWQARALALATGDGKHPPGLLSEDGLSWVQVEWALGDGTPIHSVPLAARSAIVPGLRVIDARNGSTRSWIPTRVRPSKNDLADMQAALDQIIFRELAPAAGPATKSAAGMMHVTGPGSLAVILDCDELASDPDCRPVRDAVVVGLRDGKTLGTADTTGWREGKDHGPCGLRADVLGISARRGVAAVGFTSIQRSGAEDVCGDGTVTRFVHFRTGE